VTDLTDQKAFFHNEFDNANVNTVDGEEVFKEMRELRKQ
jgi:hypothetical protein